MYCLYRYPTHNGFCQVGGAHTHSCLFIFFGFRGGNRIHPPAAVFNRYTHFHKTIICLLTISTIQFWGKMARIRFLAIFVDREHRQLADSHIPPWFHMIRDTATSCEIIFFFRPWYWSSMSLTWIRVAPSRNFSDPKHSPHTPVRRTGDDTGYGGDAGSLLRSPRGTS